MKKIILFQVFLITSVFIGSFGTGQLHAQCETWASPESALAFNDFNRIFFGAPCASDEGCAVNQIDIFEVYASEAYRINFFKKGGVYSFNICEGPGAGTWIPEFTIIAPSGAIDAFGGGDGDSCTITWTASENGEYIIAINEKGFCGDGENLSTSNGYPTLSCISDAPCSTIDTTTQCYEWASHDGPRGYSDFDEEFGGAPCDDGSGCQTYTLSIESWASEAYSMKNVQEGGEYSFNICDGPNAGSWIPDFTIIAPNGDIDASGHDGDSCTITWTASVSGTYLIVINEQGFCGGGENQSTDNGYPSITCLGGTMCDSTMMETCSAGMVVSDLDVAICGTLDSLRISIEGVSFPDGGGLGFNFVPGEGATGGNDGFFISNGNSISIWNNDINGLLSANDIDPLVGLWEISPFTYEDGNDIVATLCEFADETIMAYFNPDLTVEIEDLGGGRAVAIPSGGTEPYSFLWSDAAGSTTDTLIATEDGEYTIMVTDEVGCTAMTSVMIMNSAVHNLHDAENIELTPNPSKGQLLVNLNIDRSANLSVQIIDMNGKSIIQQNIGSTQRELSFDLSAYPDGLYMVRVVNGKNIYTQKVVLAK